MNYWTEKSIELANQKDYLDQLFKVYPMSNNLKRELPKVTTDKLEEHFNQKNNNEELIELLLQQELFPIKDSYVAYLRRDRSAIERNPKTVNRLAGIIYSMGLDETVISMTLPKETNRQIGPLFSNWLRNKSMGVDVTTDPNYFLNCDEDIILDSTDAIQEQFAKKFLGYTHNKGVDFLGKFNNKYIIGEAKFLTDFGGHQNAQLADALSVMRSTFNKVDGKEVIPISILDGVLYIKNTGKMYRTLTTAQDSEIIISSLLLRDFLYSI